MENGEKNITQYFYPNAMPKKPLVIDDPDYLEHLRQKQVPILHIHWDGSLPAEELFALAQKRGRELLLPEKDILGNIIHYATPEERIIDSAEKLQEFQTGLLKKYSIVDVFSVPVGFMQTKEDILATAIAHCRYLKAQNISYAESRFAPQYHTFGGLSLDQVIGYALEGFAQAKEETGVTVKPIICIGREASPELGEAVVTATLPYDGMVVGIDLACDERGNPPEKHYPAYKLTFDTALKRTVHAGEMCCEEENLKNIYTSITLLRADGIGHAIPLWKRYYQQHDLWEMIHDRKIRIESSPISNYNFFIENIEDLHLDTLVNAGVLVTINPDDPAMWEYGDLAHNLYVLGKLYGDDFVEKVIQNAYRARWGI